MDAVGNDRISRVVGYIITKGNFATSSPNLPQRIAVFGEANEANQSNIDVTVGDEVNSAQEVGLKYGFGSPLYHIMRILRPVNGGDGVGGIPTIVFPQAKASGATAKVVTLTVVGTATANGTHTLKIAGRDGLDGIFYDINISSGDTAATINQKIADAVNAVLGSPVLASNASYETIFTTKWKGLTANEMSVTVDTKDNALGLTYTSVTSQAGAGTPSIAAPLALFGNDWNTVVVNSYGTVSSIMTTLESVNGIPASGLNPPTGRFSGLIMKPFIAITGSVSDDPSAITDARLNDVTIAIAPAPGSAGFSFEAAANMALLYAVTSQADVNLDVAGQSYVDMPTPVNIGSMAVYQNRDAIVKKGCSTVDLNAGRYVVQDFVTTYHPIGELPPQFRYCRNLNLDNNVRFGYYLLEIDNVVDHQIANDDDIVNANRVVKPKMWKGVLDAYADNLELRGIIVDSDFMKDSITVAISTTNADRLNTFFRYKRSGIARISSTVAQAGFNFGTP